MTFEVPKLISVATRICNDSAFVVIPSAAVDGPPASRPTKVKDSIGLTCFSTLNLSVNNGLRDEVTQCLERMCHGRHRAIVIDSHSFEDLGSIDKQLIIDATVVWAW